MGDRAGWLADPAMPSPTLGKKAHLYFLAGDDLGGLVVHQDQAVGLGERGEQVRAGHAERLREVLAVGLVAQQLAAQVSLASLHRRDRREQPRGDLAAVRVALALCGAPLALSAQEGGKQPASATAAVVREASAMQARITRKAAPGGFAAVRARAGAKAPVKRKAAAAAPR